MYTSFFGFKERPFKLVPNPAYLYLSKGHEEALAHLQCAIVHEDGFVAITGEVGTGKTTLCRSVLEQLRLLSNLETTLHKLLQIVLVGQPELGELLDSHELRQLRQRITLYARLTPFTFRETREYIEHRIRIASGRSAARVK